MQCTLAQEARARIHHKADDRLFTGVLDKHQWPVAVLEDPREPCALRPAHDWTRPGPAHHAVVMHQREAFIRRSRDKSLLQLAGRDLTARKPDHAALAISVL